MSRENVEVIRRAYDAFNRGDFDGMVVDIAPEFEFVPTGAMPDSEDIYRGPEGWRRFTRWFSDQFDAARVEAREFLQADDQVAVSVILSGRGKQSGAEVRWNVWHVWKFLDGKTVHGQAFTSREDALEAAGLSE
jgi:ketosteroid isomerase-like protein